MKKEGVLVTQLSLKAGGEGRSSWFWWRYGHSIFHKGNRDSGARKQIHDSSIVVGVVTEERWQFHVRCFLVSKQTAPLAVKKLQQEGQSWLILHVIRATSYGGQPVQPQIWIPTGREGAWFQLYQTLSCSHGIPRGRVPKPRKHSRKILCSGSPVGQLEAASSWQTSQLSSYVLQGCWGSHTHKLRTATESIGLASFWGSWSECFSVLLPWPFSHTGHRQPSSGTLAPPRVQSPAITASVVLPLTSC